MPPSLPTLSPAYLWGQGKVEEPGKYNKTKKKYAERNKVHRTLLQLEALGSVVCNPPKQERSMNMYSK